MNSPHLAYRADIDGLRAVAVLSVVAFHAFPEAVPGGFVGVDVFFVISGFLITSVIFKGFAAGNFSPAQFYSRRIRRIFPALALVLIACLAAGWFLLLADEYTQLGKHVAATSVFSLNLALWHEAGYFDTAAALKPLLHLWSLGVEEQFYIGWPLLMWLAWKRRLNLLTFTLCLVGASFIYSVWLTRGNVVAAFYSPLTRFWELAIGCALALRQSPGSSNESIRNLKATVGLLLIVAGVAGVRSTSAFPGWWALLPTIGAALVISAGPAAWINRRVLSMRGLVWIGLVSYPLYLWHWPLLTFARIQSWVAMTWFTRVLLTAASVVLASLTFLSVERGARRGRGAITLAWLFTMSGILVAGVCTFQNAGFPARFPEWLRPYAAFRYSPGSSARATRCWLSAEQSFREFAVECLDDAPSHAGAPLVVIWGDSHAARLYVGMHQALGTQYRLAQFTRDSCPPLISDQESQCAQGNRYVLENIAQAKPSVVVLFAYWTFYSSDWGKDSEPARTLLFTIEALNRLHVPRVLLVGPAPTWERSLPRLVYELAARDPWHRLPVRTASGLNPTYLSLESRFRSLVADQPVSYFSVRDLLCDGRGCLTLVGDGPEQLISFDYGHFTAAGATYVARRLLP